MNPTIYNKENLNELVLQLKEREIARLRQKIANLTNALIMSPQDKAILINLNTALLRVEKLLYE